MKMRIKSICLVLFLLAFAATAFAQSAEYTRADLWQKEITAFAQSDQNHFPKMKGVVFTGSSSIRLWKNLDQDFPGVRALNRGFGGSQLEDVNYFAPEIVLPYKPKLIVLYAGDNDINDGKTPERVLQDFKQFVSIIHGKLSKTRIIFISLKPSQSRWNLREKFVQSNNLVKAETEKDKRLQFVDVWQPMLNAQGEPKLEIFIEDKLHMNAAGYKIWQSTLAP
ncbi:MAG: SGNH/GDSL hydrolase family protein, partial [Pyrinomonadaceae bacterium]